MTASKFLHVYPGIINNALGSETVIVYWRLLHLSSCELKIEDQTTFFQTLRMAVVLYLQRFGNCILTKAVWESSRRTVLCWKMHITGHHHQLRFYAKKAFYFSLSRMNRGSDAWLSAHRKLRSSRQVGMNSSHLPACPLLQHPGKPGTGKGESRKTQEAVAHPYDSYKEPLLNSLFPQEQTEKMGEERNAQIRHQTP